MRIAVVGGNGQLGVEVVEAARAAGHEPLALTHDDIELTDADGVRRVLDTRVPDLVVNTAARHHVERCEAEPARAYEVNALGPRNLARWCAARDVPLMHVSTDYVFDGRTDRPYREDDPARPLNVYGNTKLAGEAFVLALCPRSWVVRTSGLYGRTVCRDKGPNFVDRMLGLARERDALRVVTDEVLSPTPAADLARQMLRLADAGDHWGMIHATSRGSCSWFEFTREIVRLAGLTTRVDPAEPGEFPAKVPRPGYSVLANSRLATAGIDVLSDWREGLRGYMLAIEAEAVSGAVR